MSRIRTQANPKRAAIYTRCSTNEQAANGVTLAAQEHAERAYCAMRGLEVVELVVDAGVSGGVSLADRHGGRRVLELVERGIVGAVVALKLDRLFRDCGDCLLVTKAWDRAAVALHLIDLGGQAIDTSSAMGRFFLTVMAGAAELEKNVIRERTVMALAHKKANHERTGGVPFGFQLAADGVHLVEDAREQAVIHEVRSLRLEGLTLAKIGERLAASGILPRAGGSWHPMTLARLCHKTNGS